MEHLRAQEHVEVEDHELLRRVVDDDRLAFERLLVRHGDRIESICRRIVPLGLVLDVCQDVALQVWVSARSFRGEGTVAGWIGTIAHNKAVEVAVKEATRHSRIVATLDDRNDTEIGYETSDYALVVERDLLIRVMSSIDNAEDRYVFWLVYVDGLDIASVASHLCMSAETVKSRLKRAKKRLRWMYRSAL